MGRRIQNIKMGFSLANFHKPESHNFLDPGLRKPWS